jgi:predicted phosphoserine aminotransferase
MEAGKNELIRFIPGPSWVHPEVLRAQARTVIGHRDALMSEIHLQCESGLQAIFQTAHRVLISTSSGSGLMEAAVRSLVQKRSLHLVCGSFSKRWHDMAQLSGKEPEKLEVEPGLGFTGEMLAAHLSAHDPYEAIFITHNETSSGVINPLSELCAAARGQGDALICVDTVSSMGGVDIPVDELGIDFCVTSSQKCFSLPPGLAFASVSPRALEKARSVKDRGWYFDLLNLEKYAPKGHYPSTPAVTLMYALAHQLVRMLEEGLEHRFARHLRMAARVQEWGEEHLALFAPAGFRSPTLTTVRNTRAIDFGALSAFLATRGMAIANGYGDLKGQTFRIAHMGDVPEAKLGLLLESLTEFVKRPS